MKHKNKHKIRNICIGVSSGLVLVGAGIGIGYAIPSNPAPAIPKHVPNGEFWIANKDGTSHFYKIKDYIDSTNTITLVASSLTALKFGSDDTVAQLLIDNNFFYAPGSLDVSELKSLNHLRATNCLISTINFIDNSSSTNDSIEWLELGDNPLKNISLEQLPNLISLDLANCMLDSIALPTQISKLEELNLNNNALTYIVLSNVPNLTELNISNNELIYLDISENSLIKDFDASYNQLSSLELPIIKENLNNLIINNNQLASLDLTGFDALAILDVWQNRLSEINLPSSNSLWQINVSYNPFCEIDLSSQANLFLLDCSNTNVASLDLSHTVEDKFKSCYFSNNQMLTEVTLPTFTPALTGYCIGSLLQNAQTVTVNVTTTSSDIQLVGRLDTEESKYPWDGYILNVSGGGNVVLDGDVWGNNKTPS